MIRSSLLRETEVCLARQCIRIHDRPEQDVNLRQGRKTRCERSTLVDHPYVSSPRHTDGQRGKPLPPDPSHSTSRSNLFSRQPLQHPPHSPQCRDTIFVVEEVEPLASLQLHSVLEPSGVSVACQALEVFVVDMEVEDGDVVVDDRDHVYLCDTVSGQNTCIQSK